MNNFNYQPKDPSQNFDSENLAQEFNSRAGYPTRNDNYLPDPLPLDPNYYEPNFTSNFHSDVTPNKKPNLFTLQRIFIKLSHLRIQLSSRIGPEKVDPIVAYLYYECIFYKSTIPLDDYLSRFDI